MPSLLFFQGSARHPRGEAHQRGKTKALMDHALAHAERVAKAIKKQRKQAKKGR